jgi:hypothetical protein
MPRVSMSGFPANTRPIRTGTALRAASWLPATAVLLAGIVSGATRPIVAASPAGAEPREPGAIGAQLAPQPGPRPERLHPDWVQDVEISGPAGVEIAVETPEGFTPLRPLPLRLGLVVGVPYRLRLAGLPGAEDAELFPSVRVLAKLAGPPAAMRRFPIDIVIDDDDLRLAATGALVRRIIYASCEPEGEPLPQGSSIDVRPGDDAYAVAATLGDPVAEVVIGNRLPAPGFAP